MHDKAIAYEESKDYNMSAGKEKQTTIEDNNRLAQVQTTHRKVVLRS